MEWIGYVALLPTWQFAILYLHLFVPLLVAHALQTGDDYERLPEGHLKEVVEDLAEKTGFPKGHIFVKICSTDHLHSNASFTGHCCY